MQVQNADSLCAPAPCLREGDSHKQSEGGDSQDGKAKPTAVSGGIGKALAELLNNKSKAKIKKSAERARNLTKLERNGTDAAEDVHSKMIDMFGERWVRDNKASIPKGIDDLGVDLGLSGLAEKGFALHLLKVISGRHHHPQPEPGRDLML